ncbi:WhiB family transcriptional regulator [Bounagaea algeriensis]
MRYELARLPAPRTEQWDWQRFAACRDTSAAVFFAPDSERGARRRRREDAAKDICARCPVRQACLNHALAVEEPYGVWGGLTPAERRRYLEEGAAADAEPPARVVEHHA